MELGCRLPRRKRSIPLISPQSSIRQTLQIPRLKLQGEMTYSRIERSAVQALAAPSDDRDNFIVREMSAGSRLKMLEKFVAGAWRTPGARSRPRESRRCRATTLRRWRNSCRSGGLYSPLCNLSKRATGASLIVNRPQAIRVRTRVGRKNRVRFRVAHAKQYPVDLYYLMDLSNSMSDDKDTIVRIAETF